MGTANESGIYDGAIGMVRSNKTNLVYSYFPYNIIDHEPGYFVPSPVPYSVPHIYSKRIYGKSQAGIHVLYVFFNFSPSIWFYWLISMTICSILILLVIQYQSSDHKIRFKKISKRLARCTWNYAMLLIDQAPTDVSKKVSCTLIWTIIVIAIYYGIHLVFWSTLSADLTAQSPDYWIDSLQDLLYEPRNLKLVPVTFLQWNTYKTLSVLAKDSDGGLLFDRIESNRDSLVYLPLRTVDVPWISNTITRIVDEILAEKIVLIEEALWIDSFFSELLCYHEMFQGKITNMVKSKNSVFSFPAAMILSHSTHPSIVELFT